MLRVGIPARHVCVLSDRCAGVRAYRRARTQLIRVGVDAVFGEVLVTIPKIDW